jgi:DNA-binding response OmpR family regulator
LLVDDETVLVHAIGEFLRESGFIVLDAFSSQDALDLAKQYPGWIDVLVSDVVMPGLRGPTTRSLSFNRKSRCAVPAKPFRFSAPLESLRQLQSGN